MSKDKTPETKTITLKDDVIEMAKKIEAGLSADKKIGLISEKGEGLYESTLPEDLTIDVVNAVAAHNTTFIAAGTYAFGKMAIDAMKSNKALENASGSIKMGSKETLNLTMEKSQDYVNHLSGNGETTTKFGVVRAEYSFKGASKNAGQLKAARSILAQEAATAFSKK